MSFPDYNANPDTKFKKAPVLDGEVAANMKMEAQAASKLLEDLTNPDIGKEKHQPNIVLPSGQIGKAQGIAISSVTKVALVGTYTTGGGFLIVRTPTGGWSAPLYYKTHCLGVGVSLGFSEAQTVLCIPSLDAAKKFATKELKWGTDLLVSNFNASTGTVQAAIGSDVRKVEQGDDLAVAFSISSGGIVDLSVQGWKTNPDDKKNKLAYGVDVTTDDILGGRVEPPKEMEELYRKLKQIADSPPAQ